MYIQESEFTMVEEGFVARDLMEEIINDVSQTDDRDAFFVADLGDVVKKHLRFLKALPRVKPFYAVKCNSSRGVVQILAEMGAGFDCASKTEIELVQGIGVKSEHIIYANPCKQISQIKYAAKSGVNKMTFDNEVELSKISRNHPNAKMVLRIATDDSKSSGRLSVKFGAPLKACRHLLEMAKNLNVEVIGVSFHVGTGCSDPQAYAQSIADARLVFEMASEFGHKMSILDIGGGFPGTEDSKIRFQEIADLINPALDLYFPESSAVDIIAEPGRYYVASAFSLAVNIIAKKEVQMETSGSDDEEIDLNKTIMYYVNDGVYGSFNCIFFDHAHPKPILHKKPSPDQPIYSSSLWGPTCDGLDKIAEHLNLPELYVGDWLLFNNMGAYTVAASSTFNGFQQTRIHYAMPRGAWAAVQLLKRGFQQPEGKETVCTPMSCGWEISDSLCFPHTLTSTGII
ncbi:antizyme inhibitor 2 isoform X1 [Pelobates cultripes]|uniref:Antizyme inhibitor 2 isoform X1 n=1 Tax=Pelobates cultripes TaxID=61616 RepID=A0AAD1R1V2_PELCU|nr:antizyme inhibitor 2 isoform X1 [Pelobates cultripes]